MRTLLRDGLDRYEVLRADEPLRRGERLVHLSDPRGAVEFLNRLGGPGGRDLLRLAREDFAGEFTNVGDARIAAELAQRILRGELKLVQVVVAPPRLRANGTEYIVLERSARPRRGESMPKVWDQTAALSMGRLLATMPPSARNDVARISGSPRSASSLEQSRNFSRLLVTGHIRVARVSAVRTPAGGLAPPPAQNEAEKDGFGWKDAASIAAGFVPLVSEGTDIATVLSGKDQITGETVGKLGRVAAAIGIVTPFSGKHIRAAGKLFKWGDHALTRAVERGIRKEDVIHALERPLKIGEKKLDQLGRESQKFVGRVATVVVNPATNTIVTVYRTSTATVKKILKTLGGGE